MFFLTKKNMFFNLFLPKIPIIHFRKRDKHIHDLKNKIQSQKSKSTRDQIYFFTNFKGKKTSNVNSFHQMKPFDTNIIYFDGLNQC